MNVWNDIGKVRVPIKMWVGDKDVPYGKAFDIELKCLEQAINLANLPFVYRHVALMPDTHCGYGMPIGGVIATQGVVIPNAVGVDIGCGMSAVKTSLKDINVETLKKIMGEIRKVIPVGKNHNKVKQDESLMPDRYRHDTGMFTEICDMTIVREQYESACYQLGSLGGGNHFIEIQKGSDGHIWVMIHSGSRNLGYKVAKHYNEVAKELNKKWHSVVPKEWDLAFLPLDSEDGQMYLEEMNYCLEFAKANRGLMLIKIEEVFETVLPNSTNIFRVDIPGQEDRINIHHNYAVLENHFGKNVMVHRKGATLARDNLGIIPGSMGSASYIVKGKSNPESFNSCSHGAGRVMSRTKAKAELSLEVEKKKLDDQGIIHGLRTENDLDEAVGSYKDINEVMRQQEDLVEILVELKPLASIKG